MSQPAELPRVLSLRVGLPQDYGVAGAPKPMDRPWRTGFFKEEAGRPTFLGRTNLQGDGQADLRHHGGPDKALCVYPASRYPYWRERLGRALEFGAFGENITLSALDESSACLGDIFKIGQALVQISQPRSPCWKLARRWREKYLALWFQQTGYTGWYMRVLKEGVVAQAQPFELQERPYPQWPIMRVHRVRYDESRSLQDARELADCPALGESWRTKLALAADRQLNIEESTRLLGENIDPDEP